MNELQIPYELMLTNGFPEKKFIKNYGQELFNYLSNESFKESKGRCSGCGHEPPADKKNSCLYFHIYQINELNPELSKGITLCKMCHLTQHIETAIKHNWVSFINSTYSQNTIIRLNRANQLYENINKRLIVQIKKSPEQFLKEWQSGESRPTPTLKVIFTNNFVIDDLF